MRPHDPETVFAVYVALLQHIPQKEIAARHGISLGSVSNINRGRRHPEITSVPSLNAALATMACTGTP